MKRLTLPSGTIKRIHVDRIRIQRRDPGPVLTVQTSKGPYKAAAVDILGNSTMVYRPEKPLSCGARAWIETKAAVELIDPEPKRKRT